LTSVDLDVGYLGSMDNVQTIFELFSCSVERVRWESIVCEPKFLKTPSRLCGHTVAVLKAAVVVVLVVTLIRTQRAT
jgi:hypothetical protein